MPARESEAIVLRSFPIGEGDRLVSFLSRAHGRLRGVASGARRPKSRFGSTLEPFSYIRVWFYERETRELVRINQCELIESFLGVQGDYGLSLALALVSEVSEAVLGEREAAEANFRLLLLTARAIKAGVQTSAALAYFALWTVRLGGWLPRLDRCARCNAELKQRVYVCEGKDLLCANCRVVGSRAISSDAIDLGRKMIETNLMQIVKGNQAVVAASELKDYMFDILEGHVEKSFQSRKLLRNCLETQS